MGERFIFRRRHEYGWQFTVRRFMHSHVMQDVILPIIFGVAFGAMIGFIFFIGAVANEKHYRNHGSSRNSRGLASPDTNSLRTIAHTRGGNGFKVLDGSSKVYRDRGRKSSPIQNIYGAKEEKGEEAGLSLDRSCIALNIYHEARFEPRKGMYAVAWVTLNRAITKSMNACEVVFEPKQFSWANHALDEKGKLLPEFSPVHGSLWNAANEVAADVIFASRSRDFTNGATFYHADYIKKPAWTKGMRFSGKWGHHIFYIKERISNESA